jgi:hypothetical protein
MPCAFVRFKFEIQSPIIIAEIGVKIISSNYGFHDRSVVGYEISRPAFEGTGRLVVIEIVGNNLTFRQSRHRSHLTARSDMLEPNMIGMAGTHTRVGRVAISGAFVAELATGRCPSRGREAHGEN